MTRFMLFVLLAFLIVIAGCASNQAIKEQVSVKTIKRECAESFLTIREVTNCLDKRVRSDQKLLNDPHWDLTELYIAYGNAFASQVESGKITEEEAKVGWTETDMRLKAMKKERIKSNPKYWNTLKKIGYILKKTGEAMQGKRNRSQFSSISMSKTQRYIINGKIITCRQMGNFVNCY